MQTPTSQALPLAGLMPRNKSCILERYLHPLLHLWPIRASPAHGPEHPTLILQQGARGIELYNLPISQD